jgi:hypothetical protein
MFISEHSFLNIARHVLRAKEVQQNPDLWTDLSPSSRSPAVTKPCFTSLYCALGLISFICTIFSWGRMVFLTVPWQSHTVFSICASVHLFVCLGMCHPLSFVRPAQGFPNMSNTPWQPSCDPILLTHCPLHCCVWTSLLLFDSLHHHDSRSYISSMCSGTPGYDGGAWLIPVGSIRPSAGKGVRASWTNGQMNDGVTSFSCGRKKTTVCKAFGLYQVWPHRRACVWGLTMATTSFPSSLLQMDSEVNLVSDSPMSPDSTSWLCYWNLLCL